MKNPEIIAFHLPQFHAIPENNAWWGEGFTEWVNTKRAVPLFPGHYQPRDPYGKNYYDLALPEAIENQMHLAAEYGIDAFCFYHYWFNGKLLLEKPLEIMRGLGSRIDYFFCWANEPWTRAWDGKERTVLMPQEYGGEKEWSAHFEYLLDFFKDEKYKKINGKPVLVLYRSNSIERCEEMIAYFDKRCKGEGLNGIYIIEEKNNFQTGAKCENADAILEFEPMYTLSHGRSRFRRAADKLKKHRFNRKTGNNMLIFDYDAVWKNILRRGRNSGKRKTYLGAFVDWDNTPRKGKNGTVLIGYTPEKFKKYLKSQCENCKKHDSEMLFINAWNEWGEGCYLEPDERYGRLNLETVRDIKENERPSV